MDDRQEYPISDLAIIFPEMPPEDYARLVASIRDQGLLHPITVWRGEVIDGRHRLAACAEAGVEPEYEFLDEADDPLQHILGRNLLRRHLDESQRAVVAHRLSSRSGPGRPRTGSENCANLRSFSQSEAAGLLGVSRRLVSHASRVMSQGSQAVAELRQAVDRGQVRVSDAARAVDQSPEVQEMAVELVAGGESRTLRGAVRRIQQEILQREEAAARDDNLTRPLDQATTLHIAPVSGLRRLVAPDSVDAIITQPPHKEEVLPLFSDLAALAAHALKSTGVMVVVGSGMLLPQMLEHLNHPEMRWIGEGDLLFRGPAVRSGPPHWVNLHRRPLLVYGKPGFRPNEMDDLIEAPVPDGIHGGRDRNEAAMGLIVERFARPGQVVCDPVMLDRSGLALAARKLGCVFIGADKTPSCVERVWKRLADVEATGLRG